MFAHANASRKIIGKILPLHRLDHRTAGPARYVRAAETGGRIGFITPLTHKFCRKL